MPNPEVPGFGIFIYGPPYAKATDDAAMPLPRLWPTSSLKTWVGAVV